MPNWCWNTIEFRGKEKNINNLYKLFEKTIDVQNKSGFGQILHGLEGAIDGYMFDLTNMDSSEGWLQVSFQSRWNPIPNDMVRIAELFGLDFTYDYEESGMGLYGKYTFEIIDDEGCLYEQAASDEDIKSCTFKDEDDEDDEESGFDYEKMERIVETNPLCSVPIHRIPEHIR